MVPRVWPAVARRGLGVFPQRGGGAQLVPSVRLRLDPVLRGQPGWWARGPVGSAHPRRVFPGRCGLPRGLPNSACPLFSSLNRGETTSCRLRG